MTSRMIKTKEAITPKRDKPIVHQGVEGLYFPSR